MKMITFIGAINQKNKVVPNLTEKRDPLRKLLNKENESKWLKQQRIQLNKVKNSKRKSPLRIPCGISE